MVSSKCSPDRHIQLECPHVVLILVTVIVIVILVCINIFKYNQFQNHAVVIFLSSANVVETPNAPAPSKSSWVFWSQTELWSDTLSAHRYLEAVKSICAPDQQKVRTQWGTISLLFLRAHYQDSSYTIHMHSPCLVWLSSNYIIQEQEMR